MTRGRGALTMEWHDLLFLHWPVEATTLQRLLPGGVEVETFDGSAWLGIVPFRMVRTRLHWLPPLPSASAFPELNVRTYVRAADRAGVWFFSLDATSSLAIAGARALFGLPYLKARIRCSAGGGRVEYLCERADRGAPHASFEATWRPDGDHGPAAAGTLEHFLAERYSLFAVRRGRLVRGDVAHPPWRLAPAEVELRRCDMTRLLDLGLDAPPVSALTAAPMRVVANWPCRHP
jgi:uncharacterized protein YqjF (DUF2071 family)